MKVTNFIIFNIPTYFPNHIRSFQVNIVESLQNVYIFYWKYSSDILVVVIIPFNINYTSYSVHQTLQNYKNCYF